MVILMQENRSFDHYFGALAGRARAGRQAAAAVSRTAPRSSSSPTPRAGSAGTLSPWRMDTTKVDGQDAGDLDHGWPKTHQAWNQGAWNQWIAAKTEQTMGYFTRADIPWQYALADAFTVCDAYHCSLQGPTTPNRLYHWTGTIDPQGRARWTGDREPARLPAGLQLDDLPRAVAGGGGQLAGVRQRRGRRRRRRTRAGSAITATTRCGCSRPITTRWRRPIRRSSELATRASLRKSWKPDSGQGKNVDHVLDAVHRRLRGRHAADGVVGRRARTCTASTRRRARSTGRTTRPGC